MKDEYKYLYDVMLHWYMTNPEYRKDEPIESRQLDTQLIEDDEESDLDKESTHENHGTFARLQKSFRKASSRTRTSSTVLSSPVQTPVVTPIPVSVFPSPAASTTTNPSEHNLQANGGQRAPSKSPRQTVYLND
jgi:hypothetical protein